MAKPKVEKGASDAILIEVPAVELPTATWGMHINTHLTPEQSHTLRCVTMAFDERLSRLSNGRRVVNPCDALKYLLELIHAQRRGDSHLMNDSQARNASVAN
jgi:hypothetical protein